MRLTFLPAVQALTLLLAAPPVAAATPAAGAPPDPSLLEAVRTIKPDDYPSANTVLLVDDQAVVYQTDGQFTNTEHVVRLVLTPSGKDGAASRSLPYARGAEKMEVLSARVIKHDGTVIPVPASAIKDTEQSGEANIYDPNGRSMRVTFAGVAVGDAVELTSRLTRLQPTRHGFFNDIFVFQSTEPILEASYEVDGPAALPLTSHLYHPERTSRIEIGRTRRGDRVQYRWAVRRSPQLVPEKLMSFSTALPTLIVTTDPSWRHFAAWWAQVSAPMMKPTDAIKKKVAELTRDARTDEQRVKALYDFVAADVRYRGLGVGPRTGYTPRPAAETLASRWGVCRDVAILLTSMLRVAGLKAYPVLTNVGDPVLPKIAYDGFNHAIVAMPAAGGGWRYLDPTAKNSSELLPGFEREQDALVCTPAGEPLGVIPPAAPSGNLGRMIATSVVAADGSLTSKVTLHTRGMFDLVVRSFAATRPLQQQRDLVEEIVHAALPEAKLVSFKTSSPLMLLQPMEVELELAVPRAAARAGSYRLLRTVVTSGALGLVENVLPTLLGGLPTRKYTLDARMTFEYDEDETVTVPADTRVLALPNPASAGNAVSSLTASCARTAPTTLVCRRSFQLKSRFVDSARYAELRATLASLGQIARQPIILGGAGSK